MVIAASKAIQSCRSPIYTVVQPVKSSWDTYQERGFRLILKFRLSDDFGVPKPSPAQGFQMLYRGFKSGSQLNSPIKRLFVLTLAVMASGCRPQKPIEVSSLEKPVDVMLAGMMIEAETAWTVKIVGKRDRVLSAQESVYQFARSLDFSGDPSNPTWKLPEGWKKIDVQRAFRKATFQIGDKEGEPLDVVLSELTFTNRNGDPKEYIADNVNRWRKQMGVEEVMNYSVRSDGTQVMLRIADLVVPFMEPVTVGSNVMYFEKIEGAQSSSGGPPFAQAMGGGAGKSAPIGPAKNENPASAVALPFDFEAPQDWKSIQGNGVTALRYEAGSGDSPPIVAVSFFPKGAVTWENTVSMWQDQLKTGKTTDAELAAITTELEVSNVTAKQIELLGAGEKVGEKLLGVMITKDDGYWFIKMQGKSKELENQKSSFESFVASIQFRTEDKK
jgi:hypothetical protein